MKKTLQIIIFIYLISYVFRLFEFFILRTDQSFLSENLFHKLAGICVIIIVLKFSNLNWSDIGFKKSFLFKGTLLGLGLGTIAYCIGYSLEMLYLNTKGLHPVIKFHGAGSVLKTIASTANHQTTMLSTIIDTSIFAISFSLFANIINVWMEEGLFRGLFMKLSSQKYTFWTSNFIQAVLFGMWHFAYPLRSAYDGTMEIPNAVVFACSYFFLSALLAIEWGLLRQLSFGIWVGLGAHFFNNTILDLVHVYTSTGIDELMFARVLFSQILTVIIVFSFFYRKGYFKTKYPGQINN